MDSSVVYVHVVDDGGMVKEIPAADVGVTNGCGPAKRDV